jgi:predicted nuclease with TOPRIM domain
MNPLVLRQLEELETQLKQLANTAQHLKETHQSQTKEREEVLQEHWQSQRAMATYRQTQDNFDALQADTNRLTEDRARLRAHLTRLLSRTKALGEALRHS